MREKLAMIAEALLDMYLRDIEIMSQPWMYWWLLIPITFYVVFFLIKWAILTAPIWLPVAIIAKARSNES